MKKITKILIWIFTLQIMGFFIGLLTKNDISSWYIHLNKSPLNPPQIVFPITWSILYVMIAIAGFLLFENKNKNLIYGKTFYLIQLAMNWLWTPIFFTFHLISLGFFWIILISFFNLLTILFSYQFDKKISLLLSPYLLWTIFAAYLNHYILIHNAALY